ncbi:glycoside hydrolase domain-containing protein [Actinomadura citrea]|uniref:glycoside hydrolase domain-containing protein n=2 Tax=Actinomadura TaxID=1988 RepID=UPI003CE46CC8
MYALTRCLQHELGITALSDSFGPTTLSALQAKWPTISQSSIPPANIIRILQSGLYCKGYDGGEIDGVYNDRVSAAVTGLKADMGVDSAYPGDATTPKVFKGLLNMDAYVVVSGGSGTIRTIQRWMNARYINRRNFFVIPCDGNFSRDVQKALMLAIQYELGMSDDAANGVFGPGTKAGLQGNTISQGSSGVWVNLFSAAMIFNRRSGVDFTGSFTASLADAARSFQSFVKLPVTGRGDFQTWASLLVSTGDSTRQGTALDCVTEITTPRALALKAAGYQIVGRYLCNVAGTTLNKKIQPFELTTIAGHGLRVFPIYQTYGGAVTYFNFKQGAADGFDAIVWARHHGFKPGTRIYFAVDYDAIDADVTSNVIPHFRGIKQSIDEYGGGYKMGIYGPRNVCSRVAAQGLTSASFVSDMSTGFSGNLGYPMPEDWAFDQIATIVVGSGDGRIEIDNDIVSGRDNGQSSFAPPGISEELDVPFDSQYLGTLLSDIRHYFSTIGIEESGTGQPYSTEESFRILMAYDRLITNLARTLRMRKSLIQVPLLWEIRHYSDLDIVSDELVRQHYQNGIGGKTDGSTGLGQIFAATAINSRNYCVDQGLLNVPKLDPAKEADLWQIWQKLNTDPDFNIGVVPHVHIWGANDVGAPRPSLDYSDANTLRVLVRYQGSGPDAEAEGQKRLGLYQVFEGFNKPLREQ